MGGVPSRDGGRDELVSAHVAEKHEVEIGAARLTIVRILWRHADHGQKQGPARWILDQTRPITEAADGRRTWKPEDPGQQRRPDHGPRDRPRGRLGLGDPLAGEADQAIFRWMTTPPNAGRLLPGGLHHLSRFAAIRSRISLTSSPIRRRGAPQCGQSSPGSSTIRARGVSGVTRGLRRRGRGGSLGRGGGGLCRVLLRGHLVEGTGLGDPEVLERQFQLLDLAGDLLRTGAELLPLQPGDLQAERLDQSLVRAEPLP